MQKKKGIVISSVLVLFIISVILTVILTHPIPYLWNSNNNSNNVNIVLLAAHKGSHSDKPITVPFLTYQDPVYRIKIQYPSNWEKIQFDKNFIVGFVSTAKHDSGILENVMITATRLSDINTSLNNFGNRRISALESQYWDFHLVNSGPYITSTGSPLYKIEYTHTDGIIPVTTTEIWSFKGAEAFMLLANVDTSETSTYMPIFQKMINSFSSSSPAITLQSTKVHTI